MSQTQDGEKQQLWGKIRREIARLQKEFKELQMLREAADEIKYFRKYLLVECQRFD